ncbi:HEAT repeat domain-containing protein [Actinoplanes sp. NPDC049802]|uniref:NACHT domain-containing protein n=1 Tax=Actinoplanes sp. NPDC049802 TaxID=3154742 RepID=UPI0033D6FA95
MEPVSVLLPVANAVLSQAAKSLTAPALQGIKTRIAGVGERKALVAALSRAFDRVERDTGHRFSEVDVNPGFWEHEGAAELAKVLVPGVEPSPAVLAEAAVDSLGRPRSADDRLERVIVLLPVFRSLLAALAEEVRAEQALQSFLGRSDAADTAAGMAHLVRHSGGAPATQDDRALYLRWIIDQNSYVRTVGLVRNTTVQLELSSVFVGLSAERERNPGDRARSWFERERAGLIARLEAGEIDQLGFEAAVDRLHERYRHDPAADAAPPTVSPVLEMVRDTAQVLVLGDPGSGKTTLLRYLALTHASALSLGAQVWGRTARLPIHLRIAEYARYGYPAFSISEFLPRYLHRMECQATGLADLLRRELEVGGCLILLDGLDEITSAERRRGVVTAVANFMGAYARYGNHFVVTSRIVGYQAAPLPEPFRAVRLHDMDDPTVERFLDLYCREIERVEAPNRTEAAITGAAAREAAAIGLALRTTPGVRRLAANPLLLTALVLVHRASGRLPHRRIEAYVEVCNALGLTWRSAHGVDEADLPDERILHRWLTELGSWLHAHRPEGAADRVELLAVLGPLWCEHQGIVWDPETLRSADPLGSVPGVAVTDFVAKVEAHTGLLVERAPGRYGFAHLTFEEYYAGRALALLGSATDRIAALRGRLHDPRYEEPILLALGLIGSGYPEQIDDVVAAAIHPATGRADIYERVLGRDLLFLLRLLADDPPLATTTIDAAVRRAVAEYLDRETGRGRFDSYREALASRLEALAGSRAGVRLPAAVAARAPGPGDPGQDGWCRLAGIALRAGPVDPALVSRLETIAQDSDEFLQYLAGRALAAVQTPHQGIDEALTRLLDGGGVWRFRGAALEGLVSRRALTPPVIAAVTRLAAHGPDRNPRLLRSLDGDGPLPEPMISALVDLAVADDDPRVRVEAVRALAHAEALNPEVIAVAADLAVTVPEVRSAAVRALAAGRAPAPPVVDALEGLATGSADKYVRSRAIQALADYGPLNPVVVAAATSLAADDDSEIVRARAIRSLALGGVRTEPVITALVRQATGNVPATIRRRAIEVLNRDGFLTPPVVDALLRTAAGRSAAVARVRAATVLVSGGVVAGPVVAVLEEIAGGGGDPRVRTQALELLTECGPLSEVAMAAAVGLMSPAVPPSVWARSAQALTAAGSVTGPVAAGLEALVTGDGPLDLRARALAVLAAAGALTEPAVAGATSIVTKSEPTYATARTLHTLMAGGVVTAELTAAAVRYARDGDDWLTRREAVRALRHAEAVPPIVELLIELFADDAGDVRRCAGDTLADLARADPGRAPSIRAALAAACDDPSLAVTSKDLARRGWNYAYDALLAVSRIG